MGNDNNLPKLPPLDEIMAAAGVGEEPQSEKRVVAKDPSVKDDEYKILPYS
jgi:hypothetical protein